MKRHSTIVVILLLVLVAVVSTVYAATPVKVTPIVDENNSAENASLESQIERLESALAPDNPQDAATSWGNAVKTRNGAWQYALMSPELKEENHRQLLDNNWNTGTSSPWIESFTVAERDKLDEQTYIYDIVYTYTDSTKATFSTPETVVVTEFEGKWLVASVEQTPDIRGEITEISRKGDAIRIFVEDKDNVSSYDKAYVAITDKTEIFKGRTDEAVPVDQLREGMTVEVVFSGPALMSYPIQVGAGTIRVF